MNETVLTDRFYFNLKPENEGKNWRRDSKKYLHIKAIVARSGILKYPERGFNTFIPDEVIKRDGQGLEDCSLVKQFDHEEDVTSEDAKDKTYGWVKSGSTVFKDGILYCEVVVNDQDLIEQILNGGDKELSCRYKVEWRKEKGNYKGEPYDYIIIKITYNHLAVVDRGRAGNAIFLTDRKQMGDNNTSYTAVTLPSVGNKGEVVVNIVSDRAGDERQVQERFKDMSDQLKTQKDENDQLKIDIAKAKTERDTARENNQKLSDSAKNKVPIDKVVELADELVDSRETCIQLGIQLSDAEKKNPFLQRLKVSEQINPQTAKKFSDAYQTELNKGEITEVMHIKVNAMYDSAKEQMGVHQEDQYVSDAYHGAGQYQQSSPFSGGNFSDHQSGPNLNDPVSMIHKLSYSNVGN